MGAPPCTDIDPYYPLLSITIHYYPLLSITIHYYPLLSITIHYCPIQSHRNDSKCPSGQGWTLNSSGRYWTCTSPGGNLPQNLWTYPTAWHTAYPTTPRTYAMCKSPWHTGPRGQVFGLVCYFPKGFGTFYISSWILWPHPKCQGTHSTPTNCFLSTQVLRCNSHCRNNIFNL